MNDDVRAVEQRRPIGPGAQRPDILARDGARQQVMSGKTRTQRAADESAGAENDDGLGGAQSASVARRRSQKDAPCAMRPARDSQ